MNDNNDLRHLIAATMVLVMVYGLLRIPYYHAAKAERQDIIERVVNETRQTDNLIRARCNDWGDKE